MKRLMKKSGRLFAISTQTSPGGTEEQTQLPRSQYWCFFLFSAVPGSCFGFV